MTSDKLVSSSRLSVGDLGGVAHASSSARSRASRTPPAAPLGGGTLNRMGDPDEPDRPAKTSEVPTRPVLSELPTNRPAENPSSPVPGSGPTHSNVVRTNE